MKNVFLAMLIALFSASTACSQSEAVDEPGWDDPNNSAQRHELMCEIEGVEKCETALFIDVLPVAAERPAIVFQAYDLEAREGDGLSIHFAFLDNWESPIRTPSDFDGQDVKLVDIRDPGLPSPHVHFIEDFQDGGDGSKTWKGMGQSVSPVYDPETRTLQIEWDLDLYSVQDPPPEPVQRREVGSAVAPILVRCWKATGPNSGQQDVDFETDRCKAWKKYDTASL